MKFGIRKGIGGLSENAIALVVVTITIGVGATILSTIQSDQTAQCTNLSVSTAGCSAAYNASEAGLNSMTTFSDNLTTLALVMVFGVILFFLGKFLVSRKK